MSFRPVRWPDHLRPFWPSSECLPSVCAFIPPLESPIFHGPIRASLSSILRQQPARGWKQTEREVKKVEDIVRRTVSAHDLRLIASNIGATPGFSSIYTSNSASHTAFVQVSLTDDHKVGSYEYMDRVRTALRTEAPELTSYFQSGGLVDAVLNLGLPAPLDIQVTGSNLERAYATASEISSKVRALPGVQDVLIPQDIDAPAYKLAIDRERTSELGLNEKEVVSNVITALTSNQMIAPSYWVDPRTGNDYFLTVQYPEDAVKSLNDLRAIPLRGAGQKEPTRLDAVTQLDPGPGAHRGGSLSVATRDRRLRGAAHRRVGPCRCWRRPHH